MSEKERNDLGYAGFVIGLVTFVFSWIPYIGVICWVTGPVGFILSIIATLKPPRGFAITGIVLNVIGGLLTVTASFIKFVLEDGLDYI